MVDELQKIAAAQKPEVKKSPFKKFLKNTALIGAGTGAGYGLGMIGEKLIHKIEKSPIPKDKKLRLLGAAMGLAGTAAFVGREWMAHERKKAAQNE